MKKHLILLFTAACLFAAACTSSQTPYRATEDERYEEPVANARLNNKRLEKNLEKYTAELQLTKRQTKELRKIDRRYAKKERKLSRRDGTKRRHLKELASQKREEILYVLTPQQQEKLEAMVKKGRFSFDNWFGR